LDKNQCCVSGIHVVAILSHCCLQTPVNESIGNNIAWGYPGATREDIIRAAKQANAHDFIMSFPEGYDTSVGERGTQVGSLSSRVVL
jgi:ABC-type multidrug transport system fused ATPase/permease subunit